MKTIALIICLPKDSKPARFVKIVIAGIRVALMLFGAKKVQVNVSEAEYDQNVDTIDTAVNVSWE